MSNSLFISQMLKNVATSCFYDQYVSTLLCVIKVIIIQINHQMMQLTSMVIKCFECPFLTNQMQQLTLSLRFSFNPYIIFIYINTSMY